MADLAKGSRKIDSANSFGDLKVDRGANRFAASEFLGIGDAEFKRTPVVTTAEIGEATRRLHLMRPVTVAQNSVTEETAATATETVADIEAEEKSATRSAYV